MVCFFFFLNDTATTEIYTLSLHAALPIYSGAARTEIHRRARDRLQHRGRGRRPRPKYSRHERSGKISVAGGGHVRSAEHTCELQAPCDVVCRLLLEKKYPCRSHCTQCAVH